MLENACLPCPPCLCSSTDENTCLIMHLLGHRNSPVFPPSTPPKCTGGSGWHGRNGGACGWPALFLALFWAGSSVVQEASVLSSLLESWSLVQDQLASSRRTDGARKTWGSESWVCFSLVCVTSDHLTPFSSSVCHMDIIMQSLTGL